MSGPVVAPSDLVLPSYVENRTGRRQEYVLRHGFEDAAIGSAWWNDHLSVAGLDQRFPVVERGGSWQLTRHDLFGLAARFDSGAPEENDVLMLLWHVLAWGTDKSQRNNKLRIRSFVDPTDRGRNVQLLKEAIHHARAGDPACAYSTLIRRGGGKIRGLGPAFFTKLLYFASEGTAENRCLILDARVAESLSRAGWLSLPWSRRSGFSYNWYTATYASYCTLLGRWATNETSRLGRRVWPDEIERALFDGGTENPASQPV